MRLWPGAKSCLLTISFLTLQSRNFTHLTLQVVQGAGMHQTGYIIDTQRYSTSCGDAIEKLYHRQIEIRYKWQICIRQALSQIHRDTLQAVGMRQRNSIIDRQRYCTSGRYALEELFHRQPEILYRCRYALQQLYHRQIELLYKLQVCDRGALSQIDRDTLQAVGVPIHNLCFEDCSSDFASFISSDVFAPDQLITHTISIKLHLTGKFR